MSWWAYAGAVMAGLCLTPEGAAAAAPPAPVTKAPIQSADSERVLKWIMTSGDNLDLPFLIIDKIHARVFAFNPDGSLAGSAAGLIGLARGDVSPPGIGQRKLSDIPPAERITPAGRFIAALGNDLGDADILWVDYDSALSLHRVIVGNRKDNRRQRLSTATAEDNRISYGCINVPIGFFDTVVRPLFRGTNGLVYILPEIRPLNQVFNISENYTPLHGSAPVGSPAGVPK